MVPHICDPVITEPIDMSKISYNHLAGLDLADSRDIGSNLEIDIFIGSDFCSEDNNGPTANETLFEWVL